MFEDTKYGRDDTKCVICKTDIKLDKHHIWSKCHGGPNKLWNICKICPNCHRYVHQGKIIIEGWYSSTKGSILLWRNKGEESISGMPDYLVWIYGDKITDENYKDIENEDEIIENIEENTTYNYTIIDNIDESIEEIDIKTNLDPPEDEEIFSLF